MDGFVAVAGEMNEVVAILVQSLLPRAHVQGVSNRFVCLSSLLLSARKSPV